MCMSSLRERRGFLRCHVWMTIASSLEDGWEVEVGVVVVIGGVSSEMDGVALCYCSLTVGGVCRSSPLSLPVWWSVHAVFLCSML